MKRNCLALLFSLLFLTGYPQSEDSNRVNSLNRLSDSLWKTGRYDTSLACAITAQALAQKIDFKRGLAAALRNFGIIYGYQGNFSRSLEYNLKALAVNEEIGNKSGIARNFGNIGIVYFRQDNLNKALEYDFKALVLYRELKDTAGIARNLGNIGLIYENEGNYPEALHYFGDALNIDQRTGVKEDIGADMGNIGIVHLRLKNYAYALEYNLKALKLNRETGDIDGVARVFNNMGEIYLALHNQNLAQLYLDSGILIGRKIGGKDLLSGLYKDKADLDSAAAKPIAELSDFKKYILYRDSLFNEANTKKTVQAEMNYEFDQKQAVAELERKKQVLIRNVLMAGLVLVLALAFFIFRVYQQKKKANVIIAIQKEEVEKSRKKIVDSIKYAEKIQYSLLPSPAEIKKYISDYFVCFMPKDVVSGDFYWFHHYNGLSWLAVVDCTGHGVPGAFMSMLAHSFLNTAIIENKITDPAAVLSLLHQLVFRTLHQEKGDEYSQDGMDISLVAINHAGNTATFAGARNNAWLTDGEQVKILKANPKSIGGLSLLGEIEPQRPFKSETVELKKGMLMVLSTDGIADQLNAQDEKFGRERFRAMIQSLKDKPMPEGQTIAETTINKWKASTNQQDDILMMAVRI
jgi:serine phosphatase RsbU (regulator of sigma subunit)